MNRIIRLTVGLFSSLAAFATWAGASAAGSSLSFGVGKTSTFYLSSGERAIVSGVSGLAQKNFSSTDYFKATCFVDSRLSDPEKTKAENNDNYWCSPITQMNMLNMGGWLAFTDYADSEAVLDYFRKNPSLLWTTTVKNGQIVSQTPGKYAETGIFGWYTDVTGLDPAAAEQYVTDGLRTLLQEKIEEEGGSVGLFVYFENPTINPKWKGIPVSHAVTCCGFAVDESLDEDDPESLKALYIIDSDNDQFTNSGASTAPDSIIYCPVTWDAESETYEVDGLWGETSVLEPFAMTIGVASAHKITLDANGGKCDVSSLSVDEGGCYENLPQPTRSGYVFAGWYTAKTGGDLVQEGDVVDFGTLDSTKPTLYAQWLKAYTLTVKTAQTVTSKGFSPEIYVNDELYENAISIMNGDYASLVAPELVCDASDEEYVFVKWELSKSVDLGESFDAESCETSLFMPASDVTLTATYRPLYVKVSVTVGNGFVNGESKAAVIAGEEAGLTFDFDKIVDAKVGETVGAFQRWTWEPSTVTAEDLGEGFDMFSPETSFIAPETCTSFKLTAQYVSTVAGYVAYEFITEGEAEEDASFYWSPDSGKTLIPSGQTYPLAAGTIKALAFYAKNGDGETSAYWKAPSSVSLTIPKLSGEPIWLVESEWFVAAEGAKQVFFNANGGKCSVASRWYLDGEYGGTYYTLPVPETRKGYVFTGWETESKIQCCGLSATISAGDTVDLSLLDTKNPTLYAQWQKAYDLTLKGTDVTAEYDGVTYSKSVSVLDGDQVLLIAPDSYTDSKDVTYLFQCWTPSSAKYDLGTDYMASSCETTIVMPAAKLTMTATYVKASEAAWMTMYATAAPVEAGDTTIEPNDGDLVWSTDGKTWFRSGDTVLVKKGKYTVQWKSLSGVWTGPSAKTTVTIAAGDEYSNEENPAEFTFVLTACATAVVYEDGACYASNAGGTASVSPADGRLASGKSLKLTAKANKNYVFVGWLQLTDWQDGCEMSYYLYSMNASQKVAYLDEDMIDPEDFKIHFYAVFRPISDYSEDGVRNLFQGVNIGSRTLEVDYDEEGLSGAVEVKAGLGCATSVYFDCTPDALPLTYSISGTLPKGLKLDGTYGFIYGTPTAAGTYDFKVTAKDPAGHACSLAVTMTVSSVFSPIVGNWRALLNDESGACAGLLEMSVTEKGKASAKILTATGTSSVTPTVTWTEDENDPDGVGTFEICYGKSTGNEKSGSYAYFAAYPSEGTVTYETSTWKNYETTDSAVLSGDLVWADSSKIKDEEFAASFLGKYYTVALTASDSEVGTDGYRTPSELMASGYLTITTDKKGTVKVAGKLPDGEKISASTVLLPSDDGLSASAIVFVTPSGYKKKGSVALKLDLDSEGNVTSSVGTWVTPPLLDAISGVESDDELFLPGILSLAANGVVYSKLDDLTDYYLSLSISASESSPLLEYSYTDSEKTKYYEMAEAVTAFEYYLSSDSDPVMLTGGKGGKITVGKSASPWKDSDGYYHYDETKEDKAGNTQTITNPGGITISYKSATGIFSGSFKLYFDYEVPQYDKNGYEKDPKLEHKEVKCSYEGVLIHDGSQAYGIGSAVYSPKYTYQYEVYNAKTYTSKTATKTYTMKYSLPVSWSLE